MSIASTARGWFFETDAASGGISLAWETAGAQIDAVRNNCKQIKRNFRQYGKFIISPPCPYCLSHERWRLCGTADAYRNDLLILLGVFDVSGNGLLHGGVSRRSVLASGFTMAAAAAVSPFDALASKPGYLRRINIHNPRTDERLDEIYYVRGQYVPEVMHRVNNILRDVRSDTVRDMDPRLIDILSATQYLLGHDRPFSVISGYRTKATNDMLRRKSKGVAKNSYHVKGMACDLRMEGVSVSEIEQAGKMLASGGVGIYTKSDFVHLDSGPVRSWGA